MKWTTIGYNMLHRSLPQDRQKIFRVNSWQPFVYFSNSVSGILETPQCCNQKTLVLIQRAGFVIRNYQVRRVCFFATVFLSMIQAFQAEIIITSFNSQQICIIKTSQEVKMSTVACAHWLTSVCRAGLRSLTTYFKRIRIKKNPGLYWSTENVHYSELLFQKS